MKLSIIIPVYNERNTIKEVLQRIQGLKLIGNLQKEVIVIDDGSTDGTAEILDGDDSVILIKHDLNSGKGVSVKDGLLRSSGDFIVIQDADLEYDPSDINSLIRPLIGGQADVVYGSRFLGKEIRPSMYTSHYFGNRFLTYISNIFTGLKLSDMETGYKAFSRMAADEIKEKLVSKRFDIEPELTARIKKFQIKEVPISYTGRTFEESKKIGWKDGFSALRSILYFNLF